VGSNRSSLGGGRRSPSSGLTKQQILGKRFEEFTHAEQQAALARGEYPGHVSAEHPDPADARDVSNANGTRTGPAVAETPRRTARRRPQSPSILKVLGGIGCAAVVLAVAVVMLLAVLSPSYRSGYEQRQAQRETARRMGQSQPTIPSTVAAPSASKAMERTADTTDKRNIGLCATCRWRRVQPGYRYCPEHIPSGTQPHRCEHDGCDAVTQVWDRFCAKHAVR
jgi:hypothetical protein